MKLLIDITGYDLKDIYKMHLLHLILNFTVCLSQPKQIFFFSFFIKKSTHNFV